jgi:hypothetical protein
MIRQDASADPAVHELAMRLARQCRRIIQSCLREEEWPEADREFYLVIRQGLEKGIAPPPFPKQPESRS